MDLVLSVVKNRPWCNLDCYALSLEQSGFKGKRVMFVEDVPDDAIQNLKNLDFEVIPFKQYTHHHFQTFRFFIALDYLRQNWSKYRYVIWTDTSDLVFQSDPFVWMEQNMQGRKLIAAKEGRLIKDEGVNLMWINRIHISNEEKQRLMNEEVLCSGTIQGESETMLHLFEKMVEWIPHSDDCQGQDQGIYNMVARMPEFQEVTRTPEMSGGFIATVGMFLSKNNDPSVWTVEHPYFDRDTGLVMTHDRSKPFCIQHCYNRNYGLYDPDGSWRGIVENRYRNNLTK